MRSTDYYLENDSSKIYLDESLKHIDRENIPALVALRNRLIDEKKYISAKNINHILAIEETRNGADKYAHYPVIMHIELTNACNCECIMCTHAYERNENTSFYDVNKIINYLPTCKLIVLNGIGEPFIHPDIVPILRLLHQYAIDASVTTNLSYISEELLQLMPLVFKRISVSCDGACDYTFEKIRRKGSFRTFKENVRKVRSTCCDTIMHMAVTVMRQNLMEAPSMVELAASLGFDEIRFGRLETNPFLENEMDSLVHYPNAAAKVLGECQKIGRKYGVRVSIPSIFNIPFDDDLALKEVEKIKKEKRRILLSH